MRKALLLTTVAALAVTALAQLPLRNDGVETYWSLIARNKAGATLDILFSPAQAQVQNIQCGNQPVGNSTYACANTRFVQGVATAAAFNVSNAVFAPTQIQLSSGKVLIGTATNLANEQTLSGSCTITSAGVITCPGVTQISAGTAISLSPSPIVSSGSVGIDKSTAAQYFAGTTNKVPTDDVIYTVETGLSYSGGTLNIDMSTFINAQVTVNANITTLNLTNVTIGKAGAIRFSQASPGSFTSVFGATFKFAGAVAPVLSTPTNSNDILSYNCLFAGYCAATLLKDVR